MTQNEAKRDSSYEAMNDVDFLVAESSQKSDCVCFPSQSNKKRIACQ